MQLLTSPDGLPILDQFSEEGFIKCVFKISQLKDHGKIYTFFLSASHDGLTVCMGIEILKSINGGFDADMDIIRDHVYRKGVKFIRTGPESDKLISVLSRLYGLSNSPSQMIHEETFTAIALHQGNLDIANEPARIKLFGRDNDESLEENYYESFFNIDLKNGLVFWNEKDPDYRDPLIRGLSA